MSEDAEPQSHADAMESPGTTYDGPRTEIKAGDLTEEHVGKFVECHDPDSGFNYGAEILRIARREEGKAPGVSIWMRHPTLPSGRHSRDGQAHVRFDDVFQLIEMHTD
jgi:hypothetical protein